MSNALYTVSSGLGDSLGVIGDRGLGKEETGTNLTDTGVTARAVTEGCRFAPCQNTGAAEDKIDPSSTPGCSDGKAQGPGARDGDHFFLLLHGTENSDKFRASAICWSC